MGDLSYQSNRKEMIHKTTKSYIWNTIVFYIFTIFVDKLNMEYGMRQHIIYLIHKTGSIKLHATHKCAWNIDVWHMSLHLGFQSHKKIIYKPPVEHNSPYITYHPYLYASPYIGNVFQTNLELQIFILIFNLWNTISEKNRNPMISILLHMTYLHRLILLHIGSKITLSDWLWAALPYIWTSFSSFLYWIGVYSMTSSKLIGYFQKSLELQLVISQTQSVLL